MLLVLVAVVQCSECPPASALRSRGGQDKRVVKFENHVDDEVELLWVDFHGDEITQGLIMALSDATRTTFDGHAFRVKWRNQTLKEHVVEGRATVHIDECGEMNTSHTDRSREFESLTYEQCEGPSKTWSCVRYLTLEDLKRRNPGDYGIQPEEGRSYVTVDSSYVSQIPKIPQLTTRGYHKMNFTEPLRFLVDWYNSEQKSIIRHDVVPGGYTNNDKVPIDKINLDQFPVIHGRIVREMRAILQWWTGMKLKHTSTFGVRIYRRGSCLINHVDRASTHLASAVIQIAQDVDEGWPLELYLPNGTVAEVYLQPMELVLYEGAWLRHGRPMRFKGNEFANVFSHFAPPDWTGPDANSHHMYSGVPPDRMTTLAERPGVLTSNFFQRNAEL